MKVRYDIQFDLEGIRPVPHFCREWEDGEGCYGMNEHHGMTWEDARDYVAKWHDEQAKTWRAMAEPEDDPSCPECGLIGKGACPEHGGA